MSGNEKEDHLWSHDVDATELEHTCLWDAVYEMVNGMTLREIREAGMETFHRWGRIKVPGSFVDSIAESALEHALEILDDEYGGPDGSDPQPSDTMSKAAAAFAKAIADEYIPWECEHDGHTEKIDLLKWCKEHAPELLEDE